MTSPSCARRAHPWAVRGAAVSGEVHEEDPARFLRVVEAVLEAIGRGDVYQANLSRRWRAQLAPGMDEGELYRRLRAANPAPFAGSRACRGSAC